MITLIASHFLPVSNHIALSLPAPRSPMPHEDSCPGGLESPKPLFPFNSLPILHGGGIVALILCSSAFFSSVTTVARGR